MSYSKIHLYDTTGVKITRGPNLSDVVICNMVFDAMPGLYAFSVDAFVEDDAPIYEALNFPIDAAGIPELEALNRLNDYETSIYTWSSAPYRSLCAELGLDPDEGRVPFFAGYDEIGNRLLDRQADFTGSQPSEHARNAIRSLLFALHRSDKRQGVSIIEDICGRVRDNDKDRGLITEAQQSVRQLWGRGDVEITFLPDAKFQQPVFRPKGLKPSTDLSLINWDEHSYWNTGGIAIRPYNPSVIEELVLQKLARDFGVEVIRPGTAQTYMNGEGSFWARKFETAAMADAFPATDIPTWQYLNWIRRREGLNAMVRTARTSIFQSA